MGTGGEGQTNGGTGRSSDFNKGSNAHTEIVRAAGGVNEADDVLFHPVIEIERAGDFPGLLDGFEADDRFGDGQVLDGGRKVEDEEFLSLVRVVDDHFQEKPVKLRFRQRIGALLLQGVLGG